MQKTSLFRWSILLFGVLFVLLGCAGKKETLKTIEGNPEIFYKKGLVLFNKEMYSEALTQFQQLKTSFPDSPPFTVSAELKIGDCHFFKKEYVEALAAYEEFKKMHPTHEEIVYVQYQIGMSYYNQMLTLDRDQTSTKKALSNFEYLIANYPSSLFTEKAREKIGICKKRLADQEFYVGNFYYKDNKFQAAAARFEGLLAKFPKMPDEDKTLFFLGKSYLEIGQVERGREVLTRIINEYPKSLHYKETKAILDRGLDRKSLRQAKKEGTSERSEEIALIKFEEEGRQPVSSAFVPTPGDSARSALSSLPSIDPAQEGRIQASSSPPSSVQPVRLASPPIPSIGPAQEGRVQVSLPEPSPVQSDGTASAPIPSIDPAQEGRIQASSPPPSSVQSARLVSPPTPSIGPAQEGRVQVSPPEPSPVQSDGAASALIPSTDPAPEGPIRATPETLPPIKPGEEKRMAALSATPVTVKEKEKLGKEGLFGPGNTKGIDSGQPIDITSDRVESYSKENLIIFKGNVMARQKDMVIYADSLEAVIVENGKKIEKVIAGGNVKIQQGLRVASAQKAVFYNADQKVILTGDPKVLEGDNIVSGDEIIFDIEKDRYEVKGGPGVRGKAKILPAELEKPK